MPTLPFRAIVSDLDGTLLNAHHRLGEFTINTLNQLNNLDLIFATGRNHIDVPSILDKVNTERAVMITSNGARVQDLRGNLLYLDILPASVAKEIAKTPFDSSKVSLSTYQGDDWFINMDIPSMKQYHPDLKVDYKVVDFAQHDYQNVEKIFYVADTAEDLVEVEQYLKAHFADVATIVYSSFNCLEVMNKGVCKGNALRQLLLQRPYNLSDCLAFGDGMNDVEMLTWVGKGYIMENADPRLKQACPQLEQIGNHANEAVATFLQQSFNLN